MSEGETTDPVNLELTVDEMITIGAALKVALEQGAVTPEVAESAQRKLDNAIERWVIA